MSKNGARKFLSFQNKNLSNWKRFQRLVCKMYRQKAKSPTKRLGFLHDTFRRLQILVLTADTFDR
jgi:hypothetical protein